MKICWLFSVAKCLTGLWNLAYTMKISYQIDKTIETTQKTRSWVVCWDGWSALLPLPPAAWVGWGPGEMPRTRRLLWEVQKAGQLEKADAAQCSGLGEGAHRRRYGSSNRTKFFIMGGRLMPLLSREGQGWSGVIDRNTCVQHSVLISEGVSPWWLLKNGSMKSGSFARCLDLDRIILCQRMRLGLHVALWLQPIPRGLRWL